MTEAPALRFEQRRQMVEVSAESLNLLEDLYNDSVGAIGRSWRAIKSGPGFWLQGIQIETLGAQNLRASVNDIADEFQRLGIQIPALNTAEDTGVLVGGSAAIEQLSEDIRTQFPNMDTAILHEIRRLYAARVLTVRNISHILGGTSDSEESVDPRMFAMTCEELVRLSVAEPENSMEEVIQGAEQAIREGNRRIGIIQRLEIMFGVQMCLIPVATFAGAVSVIGGTGIVALGGLSLRGRIFPRNARATSGSQQTTQPPPEPETAPPPPSPSGERPDEDEPGATPPPEPPLAESAWTQPEVEERTPPDWLIDYPTQKTLPNVYGNSWEQVEKITWLNVFNYLSDETDAIKAICQSQGVDVTSEELAQTLGKALITMKQLLLTIHDEDSPTNADRRITTEYQSCYYFLEKLDHPNPDEFLGDFLYRSDVEALQWIGPEEERTPPDWLINYPSQDSLPEVYGNTWQELSGVTLSASLEQSKREGKAILEVYQTLNVTRENLSVINQLIPSLIYLKAVILEIHGEEAPQAVQERLTQYYSYCCQYLEALGHPKPDEFLREYLNGSDVEAESEASELPNWFIKFISLPDSELPTPHGMNWGELRDYNTRGDQKQTELNKLERAAVIKFLGLSTDISNANLTAFCSNLRGIKNRIRVARITSQGEPIGKVETKALLSSYVEAERSFKVFMNDINQEDIEFETFIKTYLNYTEE